MIPLQGKYTKEEKKFLIEAKDIHRINILLSVIGFVLGCYVIAMPLLPEAEFMVAKAQDNEVQAAENSAPAKKTLGTRSDIPKENVLVIPKIFVDAEINEGDKEALKKGLWRRPHTSTPDLGGNTVIAAHRFMYIDGTNTFYNLDKLKVGDNFIIYWQGKEYDYEIFSIEEVLPTAIEIEHNTPEPIVTLFTCTPLWTSEKRLVVKGKLL